MKLNVKRKIILISMVSHLFVFAMLRIIFYGEKIFKNIIIPISLVVLVVQTVLFLIWWRCPHCNKHLGRYIKDFNYCPYCGKELDELYDD